MTLSEKLKACLKDLNVAYQIKHRKIQKDYLKFLTKNSCNLYQAYHEIAVNIDRIPLKDVEKKRMKKYLPAIARLAKKTNNKSKQKILVKKNEKAVEYLLPILNQLISKPR